MKNENWFKAFLFIQIFMIPVFLVGTILHINAGEWFMATLTSILVVSHCYIASYKLKKLTFKK